MFLVRLLLPTSIVMTVCFATFASGAPDQLPPDEVLALRDILHMLGKTDWDLFSNPCGSTHDLGLALQENYPIAAVNCSNRVVNGTESYRVVGIFLRKQNLSGTLPPDLGKLPCLQVFDLFYNHLKGLIPSAWGFVKQLVYISVSGNRLTGPIPGDLAKIPTLRQLKVQYNQLSGNLPLELGSLSSLEELKLSSNNFTGELPPSFANLTSLTDFWISDNQFSGQIPSYIQNWKNLTTLYIQASGLKGPIPPLDLLGKLTDLRISDLNGSDQVTNFPLKNIVVEQWDTLILRNCNLTGPLPNPIYSPGAWMATLDLSFNSLSGEIPESFGRPLRDVQRIYLTGNLFTGPIPDWILNSTKKIIWSSKLKGKN